MSLRQFLLLGGLYHCAFADVRMQLGHALRKVTGVPSLQFVERARKG